MNTPKSPRILPPPMIYDIKGMDKETRALLIAFPFVVLFVGFCMYMMYRSSGVPFPWEQQSIERQQFDQQEVEAQKTRGM